jgi:hypothetical protein
MKNQGDGGRFGIWAMICTCAVVGVAAAGGSWQVARARVSDELAQYEKSKEWQLPETLRSLKTLSEKLNSDLIDRTELEALRIKDTASSKQISELSARVASLEEQKLRISEELAKMRSPTVEIASGEAKPIGSPGILVGVSRTDHYTNEADIQWGDKSYKLKVGGSFDATAVTGRIKMYHQGRFKLYHPAGWFFDTV